MLTPPGKDESNFPRLATSEASRKAAVAAKKKAEELKKQAGSEKKDVPALPTVAEKDDDMDVDAEIAYWRGTPVEPAAPATAPPLPWRRAARGASGQAGRSQWQWCGEL